MTHSALRTFYALLLACGIAITSMSVHAQKSSKSSIANPPPSADLDYTITAKQRGLSLNGNAIVHWTRSKDRYSITTETRAMLVGKILEAKSEGAINAAGLAPDTSTEKRLRKDLTTTTFNRDTRAITFSASDASYPIKGGEQDRNSAVWQLATLARTSPAKFKAGSAIPMAVAGQKNVDAWTFRIGKTETVKTPLGDIKAVKITKADDNEKDQKIDIWLAPSQEWYPVRVRFTEPDGDFIEQTISKLTPQS